MMAVLGWIAVSCAVTLGWVLGSRVARTRAAHVLTDLANSWDADHADWCCVGGCTAPDRQHVADGAAGAVLSNLHGTHTPLPLESCPGTCTCDTGRYVAAVREAVTQL